MSRISSSTVHKTRYTSYYPLQNPTLGQWDGPVPNNISVWWNNTAYGYRDGGVIPFGFRSILFFGTQGMGQFCYGVGTNDPTLNGTLTSDGVTKWCYDPVNLSKGGHGYPYQYQIMAFDLNDLAAVAAGTKQPWQVVPYAIWPLTPQAGVNIVGLDGLSTQDSGGAVYDPVLKRIYLATVGTDKQAAFTFLPIIHVWQVQ